MISFVSSRLMRWVVPCCSLILVLYVAQLWSRDEPPKNVGKQASIEEAHSDPLILEEGLRSKAEAVLRGYGEDEPCAVVTVAMTSDWEDVESYIPLKETKALQAIQATGESCDGESPYRNTKSSENYLVGHTKTVIHRTSPRVVSVSCLVQVSEDNAHRLGEIERAVAVALGMDFERGDTVMASVR